MKTIKEIAEEYNKMADKDELLIEPITIQSAEAFDKLLKDNKIKGYTIVPSYLGEICFEWDTKKPTSLGVSINNVEHAILEHLDHRILGDFFIQAFNLNVEEETDELISILLELTNE